MSTIPLGTPHNPNLDPEYALLDDALERAKRLAYEMGAAQTVIAEIAQHNLGFYVLLSAGYAELREKKLTDHMAPVASVLPNGKVELYTKDFRGAGYV